MQLFNFLIFYLLILEKINERNSNFKYEEISSLDLNKNDDNLLKTQNLQLFSNFQNNEAAKNKIEVRIMKTTKFSNPRYFIKNEVSESSKNLCVKIPLNKNIGFLNKDKNAFLINNKSKNLTFNEENNRKGLCKTQSYSNDRSHQINASNNSLSFFNERSSSNINKNEVTKFSYLNLKTELRQNFKDSFHEFLNKENPHLNNQNRINDKCQNLTIKNENSCKSNINSLKNKDQSTSNNIYKDIKFPKYNDNNKFKFPSTNKRDSNKSNLKNKDSSYNEINDKNNYLSNLNSVSDKRYKNWYQTLNKQEKYVNNVNLKVIKPNLIIYL